jgi:hypothetical protein
MEHDTIAFICRVVIGLALIAKIVLGFIQDKRDKKIIHVASRGRGTVDKDGNITNYTLDGYDIVKEP